MLCFLGPSLMSAHVTHVQACTFLICTICSWTVEAVEASFCQPLEIFVNCLTPYNILSRLIISYHCYHLFLLFLWRATQALNVLNVPKYPLMWTLAERSMPFDPLRVCQKKEIPNQSLNFKTLNEDSSILQYTQQ